MIDRRQKDKIWNVADAGNRLESGPWIAPASLAVLMDIRDELQKLNRLLGCPNFTNLPRDIRAIKRNVARRRRAARAPKA